MTQYWILFLLFSLLQEHCYCGIAPVNRIVNGKIASDGEFPYQLSLRRFSKHVCGASVLNANWAVTAAHCLIGPVREYSVRAGTHKRSTGGVVRSIKEILMHPLYETVSMNFDVALLQMESTLRGDMITPIPLPKTRQAIPLHGSAVVSGWGHSSAAGSRLPEDLNYAEVYIIDQEKCAEMLLTHGIVTNAMFCAAEEYADACQGDSGGPITMDGFLIGIVSWGIGCADPDYPGVYTRLSHPAIRNWIKVSTRM